MPDNLHIYDSQSEFARCAKTIPQLLESAKFFQELSEYYKHMALSDELTGLPNRHATAAYINGIFSVLRQNDKHFGIRDGFLISICDIDKFKSINDTMGHDAGDIALKEFARRLSASVRTKPSANNPHRRKYDGYGIELDLVARHGGEEFLLALPMPREDNMDVGAVTKRIHEKVCGVYDLGQGRSWAMSMSMGLDFISWHELEKFLLQLSEGESLKNKEHQIHKFLFDGADAAAYAAKNGGRAQAAFWQKTQQRMEMIYHYPGPVSDAVTESRREAG